MENKNRDLIIIGASGFGKEVLLVAKKLKLNVRGFLDDTEEKIGTLIHDIPVLGKIDSWIEHSDCHFVVAVGSPNGRKKIVGSMYEYGEPDFCTLVDPDALIGLNVKIGKGSIICAGVICTVDIQIGEHVIVNINSTIGHDCVIGDFSTIAPIVCVSGNVHVGPGAEIGTGSSVREKISLGQDSLIGMGSVVVKNVESGVVVLGNPAKVR